jgi:hypothetical protein
LLDVVQKQTLRYFWDFRHPVSGLTRERNTDLKTVTSGGSGFGLMTWIVGIERGWLGREEVVGQALKTIEFLESADRFHGAWPHWLDGTTGKTIPFSRFDDGGDIVETAFLAAGLLTLRAYFSADTPAESRLRARITRLWETIEWNWYTRQEDTLFWHWSPLHGWKMNHRIRGWNECLIAYLLAASSPTHPISPRVYHRGWATGPEFLNDRTYFDTLQLPLGPDFGGPLFFAHYSFLFLDPRGLRDRYARYDRQCRNHALINWRYSRENPKNFKGYSFETWGLTACDSVTGYDAHSPTNDLGVLSPTAALSSFPFTPFHSLLALRSFLRNHGLTLWGEFGFYDAFSPQNNWIARSFLAIDQGPIVIMIENARTALFWNLMQREPDVRRGLHRLGFSYSPVEN